MRQNIATDPSNACFITCIGKMSYTVGLVNKLQLTRKMYKNNRMGTLILTLTITKLYATFYQCICNQTGITGFRCARCGVSSYRKFCNKYFLVLMYILLLCLVFK